MCNLAAVLAPALEDRKRRTGRHRPSARLNVIKELRKILRTPGPVPP